MDPFHVEDVLDAVQYEENYDHVVEIVVDMLDTYGNPLEWDTVRDPDGNTPTILAAKAGNAPCINLLLQTGATVDARNDAGDTPLIIAALNGRTECVRILLEAGADVNACTTTEFSEETALVLAALNGYSECVRLLIDAGAVVDACTTEGQTALMCAAEEGHAECVRLLVDAGADAAKGPAGPGGR